MQAGHTSVEEESSSGQEHMTLWSGSSSSELTNNSPSSLLLAELSCNLGWRVQSQQNPSVFIKEQEAPGKCQQFSNPISALSLRQWSLIADVVVHDRCRAETPAWPSLQQQQQNAFSSPH